jgi:hypothetical protein
MPNMRTVGSVPEDRILFDGEPWRHSFTRMFKADQSHMSLGGFDL